MCGLAGILRFGGAPVSTDEVTPMVARLAHRGPDDSGAWCEGPVGLGHVRLSILDLSSNAAQPMESHDGRWILAFNGEIFNFGSIRNGLARRSALRSTGDTEVLLEHLAEHGIERTLDVLEGDFAFAAWDRRERRLILARDRHGVKPLYWSNVRGSIRFGSEIKALLDGPADPDPTSLNATLLGLSGTWGERTPFRGIDAVRPGHWLEFTECKPVRVHPFFSVTQFADEATWRELHSLDKSAVVGRVGAALEASTDLRMISDAPVACLVSGGVDSSLIAALATRRHPDLGLYHADVVGDSERPAAEALTRAVGGSLRVERVTDEDIVDAVSAVTWANEVPLSYHLNSVPFYLLSRLVQADGVKVILTGEGSDEYFVGYPQLALAPLINATRKGASATRRLAEAVSGRGTALLWPNPAEAFSEQLRHLMFRFEEEEVDGNAEEAFSFIPQRQRRLHVQSLALAQNHLGSLLHRNDRLGMAWSLESRFPFLGHDLAKIAANLPGSFKLRRTWRIHDRRHPFVVDKWAVRALADRELPRDLARREKQGFPVRVWSRVHIGADAFRDGFVADHYGLDHGAIDRLADGSTPLWLLRMLLLDVWGRLFVHQESIDEVQSHLRRSIGMATTT